MLTYFMYLVCRLLGDDVMMAMMFATRVILGKTPFSDVPAMDGKEAIKGVPAKLQPAVYEILVDNGVEYLAGDYVPVPK